MYVFIYSLYTRFEIKRVSLHACLHVCVCDCVFTCALIAGADMASCLVRLITPLSAALGSMRWWIPQQRSPWLGILHGQWLITDAGSFRLCQGERKRQRQSVYVFASELDSKLGKKRNLSYILYSSDSTAWPWKKLLKTDQVFKEGEAVYDHFAC